MLIHQGWKVALAGAAINVLMGVPYSWSIFASALSSELGWAHTQAALPYTIFLFCYAPAMIFTGRLQDKMGPRPVVILGALLVGTASFLSSFMLTPLGVSVLWGIMWGLGVACGFAALTPAAIKWFPPHKKGSAAGVVVFGMGISAVVMAPLVNYLLQYGVDRAFFIIGIIVLAGVLLLSQFISNPPTEQPGFSASEEPSRDGPLQDGQREKWYEILKFPQFYKLWIMFWFATGTGVTFVTHMDSIARVHADFEKGYIIVAVFALFNAFGRIVAGVLSDIIGRERTMTLVFSTMALVLLVILQISSPFYLGIAISFLALAYGGLFSLFPAATVNFFGEKNFGLNYGLVFSGLAAGGLFPVIAGYIFELKGSFNPAFLLLAAVCVVNIVLSFFVKPPRFFSPNNNVEGK